MEKIWLKSYDEGISSEIDMSKYSSIPDIMDSSYRRFAEKPAFHNMGKTITYSELKTLSAKFGSLQNQLRLSPGDKVALMMPNILQYPIALFGLLTLCGNDLC